MTFAELYATHSPWLVAVVSFLACAYSFLLMFIESALGEETLCKAECGCPSRKQMFHALMHTLLSFTGVIVVLIISAHITVGRPLSWSGALGGTVVLFPLYVVVDFLSRAGAPLFMRSVVVLLANVLYVLAVAFFTNRRWRKSQVRDNAYSEGTVVIDDDANVSATFEQPPAACLSDDDVSGTEDDVSEIGDEVIALPAIASADGDSGAQKHDDDANTRSQNDLHGFLSHENAVAFPTSTGDGLPPPVDGYPADVVAVSPQASVLAWSIEEAGIAGTPSVILEPLPVTNPFVRVLPLFCLTTSFAVMTMILVVLVRVGGRNLLFAALPWVVIVCEVGGARLMAYAAHRCGWDYRLCVLTARTMVVLYESMRILGLLLSLDQIGFFIYNTIINSLAEVATRSGVFSIFVHHAKRSDEHFHMTAFRAAYLNCKVFLEYIPILYLLFVRILDFAPRVDLNTCKGTPYPFLKPPLWVILMIASTEAVTDILSVSARRFIKWRRRQLYVPYQDGVINFWIEFFVIGAMFNFTSSGFAVGASLL